MTGLFGDTPAPPNTITRLTPDSSSPLWVHVIVGRKRLAKVPAAHVEALGVAPGVEWSAALAERAGTASDTLRAKLKAIALLKVRSRTSADLAARLVRHGFAAKAVSHALSELAQERLLDDKALAESKAQSALSKGMSRAAIRRRLESAGVAGPDAASAIARASGPDNELSRALEQARNRAARLPESLGATTRYRRVLAALARLGYEEDVAEEAAARATGCGEA